MKNDSIAFGIDIGGTNTKIGLFTPQGQLISYKTLATPPNSDPSLFIEQLAQESDLILASELGIHLGDPRIIGVGAGAPMANYYTGEIEHAPNLGWKDVPLKKLFSTHFKTQAVIENDANLAAIGEKKWGAGKDLNNFVLITLGTGVGTGIILNGELYRGHNALGAEGGHIIIPHENMRKCSCGGQNHLESYLSAKGIKQTIHEMTGEDWTIEKLGQLYDGKDVQATTVINRVAEELVSGLVNISVLLGPEAFIIGGGVSKLGGPFNKILSEKLNEKIHFSLKGKVNILSATLSTDKGAIYGGAAHILHEVSR